ncbi:MAG: hypothetical protein IJ079_03910 [Lachnospiraceae bacterium]|nr:hypothetical protein [Lachnospiraceae bacterium]MBR1567554.1 hypothetical protein [Lachnospiraceae bacterium]MBR1568710.1 hypothetical protein [Lachnospiraceae bacterium]
MDNQGNNFETVINSVNAQEPVHSNVVQMPADQSAETAPDPVVDVETLTARIPAPDVAPNNMNTELSEQPEEEEVIRPYTLRKLKNADLTPMLAIMRGIGVGEFKEAFVAVAIDGKNLSELGAGIVFSIAGIVIDNLPKVKKDVYNWCSDLTGLTVEKIEEMEFGTLPLILLDVFQEARGCSFFKALSKFL